MFSKINYFDRLSYLMDGDGVCNETTIIPLSYSLSEVPVFEVFSDICLLNQFHVGKKRSKMM